jgi:hypothetical protein
MFGGAVSGSTAHYLPTLIPGIIAMTTITACVAAGIQLREDMDKGVFDRFRLLPIARIAPLAGPMMADLARYAIAAGITLTVGVVMGYRPGGGVPGVLAGVVLAVITGWSIAWIFRWIGLHARSHHRGGASAGVIARITGVLRRRPRCSADWTNHSGLMITRSKRYLRMISLLASSASEPGSTRATPLTCCPLSRPLAVHAAIRTAGLWWMRLTLPEATPVWTSSLSPFCTNHTGVATPVPSRL